MRIYKRGGKYWIDLKDPHGMRRRFSAFTSKRASETFGRNVEILRDCRLAGERPDKTLLVWLDGLPSTMRDRLARFGFIDAERAHMSKNLVQHLKDYEHHMMTREFAPQHIRQQISKINRMIKECGFKIHSDINASCLQTWLSSERSGKVDRQTKKSKVGMGARTANTYISAFKAFLNWMIPDRANQNPLAHMAMFNEAIDIRRERRALSVDELRRLLYAAKYGGVFRGMPGNERALLYRIAMETGLRWSELRSLTCSSFDLNSMPPTVTLKAKHSKHRQEDHLPIRMELAEIMRRYFANSDLSPRCPVFPNMPEGTVGAKMIRYDLAATGDPIQKITPIPYILMRMDEWLIFMHCAIALFPHSRILAFILRLHNVWRDILRSR